LLSAGDYLQVVALFTCLVPHKLSHAVHKQRSELSLSSARTVRTFEITGAVQLPRILMGMRKLKHQSCLVRMKAKRPVFVRFIHIHNKVQTDRLW